MYHFAVQNMEAASAGCATCCCERLALKPGTTTKMSIGYASWAVPIGRLHCGPSFDLEQKETCATSTGAPQKIGGNNINFDTPMNTMLEGDLLTKVEDPDGNTMIFKALGLYGPKHGTLVLEPNGLFDYTPSPGYEGEDRFFFTATDETGKATTFEALIGVGATTALSIKETPHVSVDLRSSNVNQQYYQSSFAITVAPTAELCEIWRLTVMQNAIDCECVCYNRTDCYDIEIAKC
jgi:hypothetical protein